MNKVIKLNLCLFLSILVIDTYTKTINTQYFYDRNGNIILQVKNLDIETIEQYHYLYDQLNHMVAINDSQSNKTNYYAYYPNGKRLAKWINNDDISEKIEFYYSNNGNLLNEVYRKNRQVIKKSSYFAGSRFIEDEKNPNNSYLQYPLSDLQNHPATINFKENESNIESYQLTDYGQLNQSINISQSNKKDQKSFFNFELNPMIYGSGYHDRESNLQYMGARYYSADMKRFMAQDSYNLLNRYNYANGNPVMNYDPDGHKSILGGTASLFRNANSFMGSSTGQAIALTAIGIGVVSSLGYAMMTYGAIEGSLSLTATTPEFELVEEVASVAESASSSESVGLINDYSIPSPDYISTELPAYDIESSRSDTNLYQHMSDLRLNAFNESLKSKLKPGIRAKVETYVMHGKDNKKYQLRLTTVTPNTRSWLSFFENTKGNLMRAFGLKSRSREANMINDFYNKRTLKKLIGEDANKYLEEEGFNLMTLNQLRDNRNLIGFTDNAYPVYDGQVEREIRVSGSLGNQFYEIPDDYKYSTSYLFPLNY